MQKLSVVLGLVMALGGCAILQPGSGTEDAAAVGYDVGDITCTVLAGEAPADVRAEVLAGLERADVVLEADQILVAALTDALSEIQDERWRLYAQAGLRVLIRRLAGGDVPIAIASDSAAAVGAGAFVDTCLDLLGGGEA